MRSQEVETIRVAEEAEAPRRRRRRRRRRESGATRSKSFHHRTRLFYFSMASLWGCLVGTGAVVIVLRVRDAMPTLDRQLALSLVAALVACVVGAGIVSAAYRSTTGRER